MVPATLDEAVDFLLSRMSEDDKVAYRGGAPIPHFTLGMTIRNEWSLWDESPLSKWFKDNGIHHADDMSGTIFDALRARLRGESFDIKAKADWYRRFWEWSASCMENGGRFDIRQRKDGSLVYPFEEDYPRDV
jgi:hypothetical protein